MFNREEYINRPIEIEVELRAIFDLQSELIIFDIGACEAEDSIRYANLFKKATVYAFEPRTDNCEKAKELIQKYNKTNIVLENIALSNENGVAEFYFSEGKPTGGENYQEWNFGNKSSSLLAPSEEMKKHTEWLSFNKKIQVNTVRLEDYVATKQIQNIDFIHMDVQGAELMVLDGAGKFLNKIKLIWLEVEAVELYKGQPLKNNVEEYMQKNNFVNILDTVDTISGDQLYVNRAFFSEKIIQDLVNIKKKKTFFSRINPFLKNK